MITFTRKGGGGATTRTTLTTGGETFVSRESKLDEYESTARFVYNVLRNILESKIRRLELLYYSICKANRDNQGNTYRNHMIRNRRMFLVHCWFTSRFFH